MASSSLRRKLPGWMRFPRPRLPKLHLTKARGAGAGVGGVPPGAGGGAGRQPLAMENQPPESQGEVETCQPDGTSSEGRHPGGLVLPPLYGA